MPIKLTIVQKTAYETFGRDVSLDGKKTRWWHTTDVPENSAGRKIHAPSSGGEIGPLCRTGLGERHRQLHQDARTVFLVSRDPDNKDVTCVRCLQKLSRSKSVH